LQKYEPILKAMTDAKYNTALLVQSINKMCNISIQSLAVKSALDDITYVHTLLQKTEIEKKDLLLMRHLAVENVYTVVAYPVVYHYDTFKHNKHSLENKMCFKIEFNEPDIVNMGRGGFGNKSFCFALLDWTSSESGRRRRHYIANGGIVDPGSQVTRQMWIDRFGANVLVPNNT
jgi:hypothetical protein